MKMSSFRYIFPQAFKSLRLNGWMTFAAVMTVAIALFLCTLFALLVLNIDLNVRVLESDVRVVAYVADVVDQSAYPELEERLRNIPGVKNITYVDREEALDAMGSRFGTDLRETLDYNNPLPDSYSIEALSVDDVAAVAEAVQALPQITEAKYGKDSVDKLFQITDTMRKVGLVIMALLAIAAVVLVAMTIRLTVLSRQRELKVMKWVGATNAFVRWPFFIEGILLGVIGAALALGLVLLGYQSAVQWLSDTVAFVTVLNMQDIWLSTCLATLAAGVLMGVFGSTISLSRFLKV